jgi:hypothetical protein
MSATCLQNFVVTVVWKNYQSLATLFKLIPRKFLCWFFQFLRAAHKFCMHYEHKLHFAALIVLMPSASASGINMTMRAAKCKIMLLMHK